MPTDDLSDVDSNQMLMSADRDRLLMSAELRGIATGLTADGPAPSDALSDFDACDDHVIIVSSFVGDKDEALIVGMPAHIRFDADVVTVAVRVQTSEVFGVLEMFRNGSALSVRLCRHPALDESDPEPQIIVDRQASKLFELSDFTRADTCTLTVSFERLSDK